MYLVNRIQNYLCDLNFFICFREVSKQAVVEDKLRTQEDKPEVQAEAAPLGQIDMVRYRKDSQFLPNCSMKEFFHLIC